MAKTDVSIGIKIDETAEYVDHPYEFLAEDLINDLKHYGLDQDTVNSLKKPFSFKEEYFQMEEHQPGFFSHEDMIKTDPEEIINALTKAIEFMKQNKDAVTDFTINYLDDEFMDNRVLIDGDVWIFESNDYLITAKKELGMIDAFMHLAKSLFGIKSNEDEMVIEDKNKVIDAKTFDGEEVQITFSARTLQEKYEKHLEKIIVLCEKAKEQNKMIDTYLC